MKTLTVLLLLSAILTLSRVAGENSYEWHSCPDGWTMYPTRCLHFVPIVMTWDQAKDHCEAKEGTLASVYDAETAEEIQKEMQTFGHTHGKVWIGGNESPENPTLSWIGDPSVCRRRYGKREGYCLRMTHGGNAGGCLDYTHCGVKLPSVCSIILV